MQQYGDLNITWRAQRIFLFQFHSVWPCLQITISWLHRDFPFQGKPSHPLFNTFPWVFIQRKLTHEFWDKREYCRKHPSKSARVEKEGNLSITVCSVQGSSEHNLCQTAQTDIVHKIPINLASSSSSCNTTGLLVLPIRKISIPSYFLEKTHEMRCLPYILSMQIYIVFLLFFLVKLMFLAGRGGTQSW